MSRDYKNRIPGYAKPKRKRSSQTWWVPGAALTIVVLGFIVLILAGGDDDESSTETESVVPLTSDKDTQQLLSLHPSHQQDSAPKDRDALRKPSTLTSNPVAVPPPATNPDMTPLVLPANPLALSTPVVASPAPSKLPVKKQDPSSVSSTAKTAVTDHPEAEGKSTVDKQEKNEPVHPAASVIQQRPAKPKPPEPRFSFYELLPEKEILIQENEIRALKREEVQGKSAGVSGSYILQAGSFPTEQEAAQLKERLQQLKVKARMEVVLIEGSRWYRVKIGPYSSLLDADKMRLYLRRNEIDTVVQKDIP